jgi:hypothetical protein
MGEKPRIEPDPDESQAAASEISPREARAAEAAELIAAGEVVDEPTVRPPEGFNVRRVVRLPDRAPEELEKLRQELDGPKQFTSPGKPRQGSSPIHEGGKRRRGRGLSDN